MENRERRRLKRCQLLYYLKTFDADTEELVGRLIDINVEGLKLVSGASIQVGAAFNLMIELPIQIFGQKAVKFRAQCQWCRPDVNPSYFAAGFQYVDPTQEESEIISALITNYIFQDG
jgi:hypothetical protein